MIRTLMIFSTVDGHALAISRRIAALLEARGHEVTLLPVDEAFGLDCAAFDRILIGASIRYGRHRPAVYRFIRERRDCLQRMPSGFFSVSAVARKPGKDASEGNAYFRKLCALTGWTPPLAALFAGRIDYARYRVWDRLAIRCIMWLTDGPTDTRIAHEFTDWEKVAAFARHFAEAARD